MTDGPDARVAEAAVNALPKPRGRAPLHKLPGHHAPRDRVMEFPPTRSGTPAGAPPPGGDPKAPPEVRPAAAAAAGAAPVPLGAAAD